MRSPLSEAWGQFLSRFPWDWFLSLTFRDDVKSFRAHRLYGYFVRDLEKAAGGTPIFWFRADEIGPRGGRFHMHALIGNVAHLRRMSWIDRWDRLAGYARIVPFNARKGAAYYCAKYVTKQFGDWDLSDNLDAFRLYQPALPLSGPTKTIAPTAAVSASMDGAKFPGKRAPQQVQYPLTSGTRATQQPSDPVFDVYASEVTRGRGRFRQLFFPPEVRRE